jgi:hypothetical protein
LASGNGSPVILSSGKIGKLVVLEFNTLASLTFYHQVRADGGVRTGIETDGAEILHSFTPGGEEDDPALLWYVDVECEGANLPRDGLAARDWFLIHSDFFVAEFARIADEELILQRHV